MQQSYLDDERQKADALFASIHNTSKKHWKEEQNNTTLLVIYFTRSKHY